MFLDVDFVFYSHLYALPTLLCTVCITCG